MPFLVQDVNNSNVKLKMALNYTLVFIYTCLGSLTFQTFYIERRHCIDKSSSIKTFDFRMCQHLNIWITKSERIDINQIEMQCLHTALQNDSWSFIIPLLIGDWHIIYVENIFLYHKFYTSKHLILIPQKIVTENIFAALRENSPLIL